jgi:hypothetical protein
MQRRGAGGGHARPTWSARSADASRLEATLARLDAEAAAAVVRPSRLPTAAEARAYLESLPELWAKTSDAGRHAIAEAVFERVEVLGLRRMRIEPTPSAVAAGLVEAFSSASAGYGRGERI